MLGPPRGITTGHLRRLVEDGRLMGLQDMNVLLDVSRQRIHQMADRGDLPKPLGIIGGIAIWDREEVLDYLAKTRP